MFENEFFSGGLLLGERKYLNTNDVLICAKLV